MKSLAFMMVFPLIERGAMLHANAYAFCPYFSVVELIINYSLNYVVRYYASIKVAI